MKRLALLAAAAALAAIPAVIGLTANPALSHRVPVRIPSGAQPVRAADTKPDSQDNSQDNSQDKGKGSDDAASPSARPSRHAEPGDDKGGRTSHVQPGDDRGGVTGGAGKSGGGDSAPGHN